jgi:hypothetical protein
LLPGFAFLFGYTRPGRKIREISSLSASDAIAGVIFVALIAHLLFFAFVSFLATILGFFIPEPSLYVLFELLYGQNLSYELIRAQVQPFMLHIASYFIVIVAITYLFGRLTSVHYKKYSDHMWAYDLSGNDGGQEKRHLVQAFVMTNVQDSNKILMYRGGLEYFRLKPDGTIAYLILDRAARFYMKLEDNHATMSSENDYRIVGGTSQGVLVSNRLIIEGEDIANVVFQETNLDQIDWGKFEAGLKELRLMPNE